METALKISLAATAVGLAGTYYSKGKNTLIPISVSGSIGALGIAGSLYFGVLKDHPKRVAGLLIPVGLFVTVIGNISAFGSGAKEPQSTINTTIALSTTVGAITYLAAKGDIKKTMIAAIITAAIIYSYRSGYLDFLKKKKQSGKQLQQPIVASEPIQSIPNS